MLKNGGIACILLVGLAIGLFFFLKNRPAMYVVQNDTPVPAVSTEIVWNAYSIGTTVFIYPSDWIFTATSDTSGFSIVDPTSSNSADRIDVGGSCATTPTPDQVAQPAKKQSACINNIFMYTDSINKKVLNVFNDMKTFGEQNTNHAN